MRRSTTLYLSLIAVPLLVLSGCGDDDTTDHDGMGPGMGSGMGSGMDHDGDGAHRRNSPVAEGARRIEVTATSFEFDPDEITVTAGEEVAVVLRSDDTLHDFTIDELDAHVSAEAGETAVGGFRADDEGRYTYFCTVAGHREAGMEGTLVVEGP